MKKSGFTLFSALASWLLLGLFFGLLLWPYQAISALGFRLQEKLWFAPLPHPLLGGLVVFTATSLLLLLAWGPLAAGRGGGVAPVLALDRASEAQRRAHQAPWLEQLSLLTQLKRLPLMLLTHVGGLAVGVESPSVALGASLLLAIQRRLTRLPVLANLSPELVAVVGGAAGLGAAFRSPLLAVAYGLEELGQRSGLPFLLPSLLLSGSATLLAPTIGQPARLPGLDLGLLAPWLWAWTALLTLVGAIAGAMFARLLLWATAVVKPLLTKHRFRGALLLAACLTMLALLSQGRSLNDGSLLLGPALAGEGNAPPITLLWRGLASVISVAVGAPGGLMHNSMTLGALLITPLQHLPGPYGNGLDSHALAQLAAVAATALFAGAHGAPLFCAAFVFTLQGDPELLPLLLLVAAVASALGDSWRGEGWNDNQVRMLLDQH